MGAVYEAVHVRLRRPVALKLLPSAAQTHAEARSRFEREMQAVGAVSHPGIVQGLDADEVDGQLYLAMELVDGQDLARVASAIERPSGGQSGARFAVAAACEAVRQAAVAIQAAHDAGLIHRDLKPSNLMLTPDGQVKVLDLGLAAIDGSRIGGPALEEITASGQIMGTIDYVAPEQAGGQSPVDGRADVYSLAATLYRLLAGRPPLPGGPNASVLQRLTALATAEPEPIETLRDDCPAPLAAVLDRAMAKDPQQRTPTAGQLAEELARFADRAALQAVAAAMPPPAEPIGPIDLAVPASAPDAEVETLRLSQLGASDASETIVVRPSDGGPVGRPRRKRRGWAIAVVLGAVVLGAVVLAVGGGLWWGNADRAAVPPRDEVRQAADPTPAKPDRSTGLASDAPAALSSGIVGLRMDAPSDLIPLSARLSTAGPWTIEADVVPAKSLPRQSGLSDDVLNLTGYFALQQYGNVWVMTAGRGIEPDFSVRSPMPIVVGKPTHLAGVFDGSELLLFVDGQLDGVAAIHGHDYELDKPEVRLGNDNTYDPARRRAFNGIVKAVRLSDIARYSRGRPPTATLAEAVPDGRTVALFRPASQSPSSIRERLLVDLTGRHEPVPIGPADWIDPVETASFCEERRPTASRSERFAVDLSARHATIELAHRVQPSGSWTSEMWVTPRSVADPGVPNRAIWQLSAACIVKQYDRWLQCTGRSRPDGSLFVLQTEAPIQPGRPVHLAAVSNGSRIRFFADGVEAPLLYETPGTPSPSGAGREPAPEDAPLRQWFGHLIEPGTDWSPFDGLIDEFRFSRGVRYTGPFQPPRQFEADATTDVLYRFDEGSGPVVENRAGDFGDGYLEGAEWVDRDEKNRQ